jgi:hypothetical protein
MYDAINVGRIDKMGREAGEVAWGSCHRASCIAYEHLAHPREPNLRTGNDRRFQ